MTTRVIVTARLGDWHACMEGRPSIWGAGKTIESAIESCKRTIQTHDLSPDLEVRYSKDERTQLAIRGKINVPDQQELDEASSFLYMVSSAVTGRRL